ncbi:MAG: hypothetical protein ABSG62_15280 [Terracidiphilus sp.]|jgi:hypothetical protein
MALASRAPANAEGHGFTCEAPGNAFNDNVDNGLYDAERQLSPRSCPSLFCHKLIWAAL